jgi:hypothetical protein
VGISKANKSVRAKADSVNRLGLGPEQRISVLILASVAPDLADVPERLLDLTAFYPRNMLLYLLLPPENRQR